MHEENNKTIESNMAKTMKSIYESFDQGQKCKDLIYFVEDDFLHKDNCREILLEGLRLGAEYASLYDHPDKYLDPSKGGNP